MTNIDSDTDNDLDKMPAKRGKKWTDEDDEQMLKLISEKKSVEDISEILERTPNGVKSHLDKMVYDSYLEKKSFDEISKWSGMNIGEIEYVISVNSKRENRPKPNKDKQTELTDLKQIINLLTDIQSKVNTMIENHNHNHDHNHNVQTENISNITKPKSLNNLNNLNNHNIVVVKPEVQTASQKKIIIVKGQNR